jgi:hypothetical protein
MGRCKARERKGDPGEPSVAPSGRAVWPPGPDAAGARTLNMELRASFDAGLGAVRARNQPFSAMRMRGLEPPRGCPHTDLNRARLPIPPHPRGRAL